MSQSIASLMGLSQSEAERFNTFTDESPKLYENYRPALKEGHFLRDPIEPPELDTTGITSPDRLYMTHHDSGRSGSQDTGPYRSYMHYQDMMYSEVNTIYNAIDYLSGGQLGRVRSNVTLLTLMGLLLDGELNLKDRMEAVWSKLVSDFKISLPRVDWNNINWTDTLNNTYSTLRNAFQNLRDYYYQIRSYDRNSPIVPSSINWSGNVSELTESDKDDLINMLRQNKVIPTSRDQAGPDFLNSYSAYNLEAMDPSNTIEVNSSNKTESWSNLNAKVRQYVGDLLAITSEPDRIPGNIIYGTQPLSNDNLKKYASTSRPYPGPQILPKGVERVTNPLTLNDLRQNALSEGFAVGYRNFAGFEMGSDHDWRIKLKPYRSKGSGFGTWNRSLPSYSLPNLWKDKTSVTIDWSTDSSVNSVINAATDRLYSRVIYGVEGTYDITAKDVAQALVEAKNSNIRTFDFSEDTPVLTYNLNFGTPRTESMPLFNGSSMEVLTGMNYQVTLGMSILDDVYGSMFKYMVDYNNHVYNIENNEVAPYWLTAFEIDLLILRTGKIPKHQYKLIGVPIDFNPSHEGSDAPQECRINLTFGIIGMIGASNNYIDAEAPDYNRGDETWNSIQIQLGNSKSSGQNVPHRDAVYRDLKDSEFKYYLTDEEKNKVTLSEFINSSGGSGSNGGSESEDGANSEAEVKDPLDNFGWYANLEPEGKKIVTDTASDILNTLFAKGVDFRINVVDLEGGRIGGNKVSMYEDNHTRLYDTSWNNTDDRNANIIKTSDNLVRICYNTQSYIMGAICKCLLRFEIDKSAVNSQVNNLIKFITFYAHQIWIQEKVNTNEYPKKEGKVKGLTVEQLLSFQSSDWHGKFSLADVFVYVRKFAKTYLEDPGSDDWKKLSRQDGVADINSEEELNKYFNMNYEFETSSIIGSEAYNNLLSKFK